MSVRIAGTMDWTGLELQHTVVTTEASTSKGRRW